MICYICLDQFIFNARNRRTVKKYDVGTNTKAIIKRLYNDNDILTLICNNLAELKFVYIESSEMQLIELTLKLTNL